jgi:hypothetical protein
VGLPLGEDEADRSPCGVDQGVNLGGQAATGAPNRAGGAPRASWWAFAMVASTMYATGSVSLASTFRTRPQMPARFQREKRV